MPKEYELTDEERRDLFDYPLQDIVKQTAHEAQKKLAEYLKSECMLDHFIDNFITGECHSTCKSCQLLKDFGL